MGQGYGYLARCLFHPLRSGLTMNEQSVFAFLKNLGNEFLRSAPAWTAWKRDKVLIRDAAISLLVASDAPLSEIVRIWRWHEKVTPVQMRVLAATPDWLEHPDVRNWLKAWAGGAEKLTRRTKH